ncbi:MAG: hypothetical protein II377_06145 [Clostridia bacterium]|nr:hypothetical protein [Clostridia bacterium]
MSFIKWLDNRLTNFTAEAVNKETAHNYENVFYSNNEYYLITDGRPALKEDCMDTVEYTESFTEGTPHCIGYPFWQKLGFKETDKILCQGFYNISMLLNKTKAV